MGSMGWADEDNDFTIERAGNPDEKISGPLHFPHNIATIISILEHYNTLEGVYHALVYEMVIEGMVSRNPERHESCLDSPCSSDVCADICPPEKCEEMKGGGS